MPDTVAALFRTRSEASEALRKLKEAGFGEDQVSLATPRRARRGHYGLKVAVGILTGTLLGALIGALVTGMVPGVRPLVSGSVLATFLFAAVAGAATGGLAGNGRALLVSSVPEEPGDKAAGCDPDQTAGRDVARKVMAQVNPRDSDACRDRENQWCGLGVGGREGGRGGKRGGGMPGRE